MGTNNLSTPAIHRSYQRFPNTSKSRKPVTSDGRSSRYTPALTGSLVKLALYLYVGSCTAGSTANAELWHGRLIASVGSETHPPFPILRMMVVDRIRILRQFAQFEHDNPREFGPLNIQLRGIDIAEQ
jgi:hypothetical protein